MNDWAVYRLDYNANEFLVEKGLSQAKAEALAADYIQRGHHQHYWADKQPASSPDFVKLLKGMLDSGSALVVSVKVLLSQGASDDCCVEALTACTDLDDQQCREVIQEASQTGKQV